MQLSLSEVEEAINRYSVEKMAESYARKQCDDLYDYETIIGASWGWETAFDYKSGFKAHQELVKDKLFTVDDMKKVIELAQSYTVDTQYDEYDVMHEILKHTHSEKMIIDLLLPKTEWDIEIVDNKIKLL